MYALSMFMARFWDALRPSSRPVPEGLEAKYSEILRNSPMKSWRDDKINMRNDVVAVTRDFQVTYQKVKEEVLGK